MGNTKNGLVPGLLTTHYVYDRTHGLMAADVWRGDGPNIGRRGRNLTISCLSLNRSALTVRLLDSIARQMPDFAGEFLIIDNASCAAELDLLRAACARMPFKARIVELGDNYGVGEGRNRTMPHVTTEWVMCLDNDIYFTTDPLTHIQRDIALLGCHFLNVPLLDRDGRTVFARGGHLYTYVWEGALSIGGGSVYQQAPAGDGPPPAPWLSTFLFGGASVFRKDTFLKLGGYDEAMFIGFEDTDFSIRLFQEGYKVGNTGVLALVHDHPPPEADDDRNYERKRFSRDVLKRSAEHMEAKHGITVWNPNIDAWLEQRHRELGIAEPDGQVAALGGAALGHATQAAAAAEGDGNGAPRVEVVPRKPKVALLVDTEGWCFWNISQQLQRYLGSEYDFRIITTDVIDHAVQAFLMARDCDIIHVFWREYLGLLPTPHCIDYLRRLGSDYPKFLERVLRPRVVSTCIYDHLNLGEAALAERRHVYRELADIYYVGSRRLYDAYSGAEGYTAPAMVLEDGVDLGRFYPTHAERFEGLGAREVVVGWVGNSEWSADVEDFKGVKTILRPAIEQLRAEGLPIRACFADKAEGTSIPHERMVDYYAKTDVYVCTSKIEGTPNPVLEAMACGVPVISTDVGIVPQAFGSRQREFILRERSIECLKTALRRLISSPQLFAELSRENLESIRTWDWSVKTRKFAKYFQECLARGRAKNGQPV